MDSRPGKASSGVAPDSAVAAIEESVKVWLVDKALAGILAANPTIAGWLSGPIGWLLGLAAGIFIKYADLLSYIFIDDWQTSAEATNYENAAQAAQANPSDSAARAAQEAAFQNLFG